VAGSRNSTKIKIHAFSERESNEKEVSRRRFMTMRVRGFLMLVAGLAVMGLASCGHYTCGAGFGSSTCTSSGPPNLGGGGNGASGTVFAYLLSETGASDGMAADTLSLSANTWAEASSFQAPPLPSTTPLDGGTVVVNLTSQRYLYIPFHNGTVYGYSIDGTSGALTSVPNSPYTVIGGTSITANPAGTLLFVSDFGTGDISVFNISPTDGSLSAVSGSPFPSGILAGQIATDGLGKYLYVSSGLGGSQVAALTIGSGTLSTVIGSPFSFSMSKVLGENSGKYLLGISGLDSHVYVFGINAQTGAITEIGTPTLTASLPVDLAVSPSGSFVYTFDGLSLPMEGYQLDDSTGTLTVLTTSPFTGVNLETGKFDQSGLFLFGVAEGQVAVDFAPYGADTSTGVISAPTFTTLGFPGGGFAVSDLNSAP
jgi:6-phosphogluconolactonase (cycloisomerase 2 family)